MLPIQDVIPSARTPRVTIGLLIVGAAAIAYQLTLSSTGRRAWLLDVGLVPAVASPWHAVSALFVPTDLVAGLAGLLALWIFGDNVEDRLGRARFLALFVGGGALAAWAGKSIAPDAQVVLPASAGALAAVIGAYMRLLPRSRVMVLVPLWRDVDLVDVPAPLIAAGWFFVHVLRHAGGWLTPAPMTATLVIPLAGFGVGVLVAHLTGRRNG